MNLVPVKGDHVNRKLCPLLALGLLLACNKPTDSGKAYTIAVIPQGSTHEYWKSIHAGAAKAAQELGAQGTKVNIIWKGPLREDDREQQTQVVEGFISQNVSGIVGMLPSLEPGEAMLIGDALLLPTRMRLDPPHVPPASSTQVATTCLR